MGILELRPRRDAPVSPSAGHAISALDQFGESTKPDVTTELRDIWSTPHHDELLTGFIPPSAVVLVLADVFATHVRVHPAGYDLPVPARLGTRDTTLWKAADRCQMPDLLELLNTYDRAVVVSSADDDFSWAPPPTGGLVVRVGVLKHDATCAITLAFSVAPVGGVYACTSLSRPRPAGRRNSARPCSAWPWWRVIAKCSGSPIRWSDVRNCSFRRN